MQLKLTICALVLVLSGCKTLLPTVQNGTDNNLSLAATAPVEPKPVATDSFDLTQNCAAEPNDIDPHAFSDVWDRVKAQLTFEVPDKRRVRAQKSWYSRHPEYMQRVTERAEPYLFHIVEELEKHNMPLELALLPIVESAFDPFAYSHGRASGMWQFIPGTGRTFGLKQNWWYDGRRDVYMSTQAAIKYLAYLNKRFDGNWLHALAAYNSGEGNVSRAIRRNKKKGKPTDFWSLKLPRETQAYVPKLLALAELLSEKNENVAYWSPVANLPYFDLVDTESQIDISLAAALAELSMNDFYRLNPAFNQWATSPEGPHHILLPIEKISVFKQNLKTIPKAQRISFKSYQIKQGDSLIKIAQQHNTTVALLKSNNNIRGNSIRAGKKLLIPVPSKARDEYHKSANQRLLAKQSRNRAGTKINYIVKSGDSFWDISRLYKVNMRKLAAWNNMAPTDPLKVGQKLVVWTKQPTKLASLSNSKKQTKKIYYKVRRGDSLARIANKFNVSLGSVKKWNRKMGNKKYLQPGDSLTLYVDITRQY
ncbi:LysM peptidoglycan-binding domain-containing protein [Aliikangiella sp. IMCC44632]